MSQLGQTRQFDDVRITSAYPLGAAGKRTLRCVSNVPKNDIESITLRPRKWQGS
jgi:hypothetical protein